MPETFRQFKKKLEQRRKPTVHVEICNRCGIGYETLHVCIAHYRDFPQYMECDCDMCDTGQPKHATTVAWKPRQPVPAQPPHTVLRIKRLATGQVHELAWVCPSCSGNNGIECVGSRYLPYSCLGTPERRREIIQYRDPRRMRKSYAYYRGEAERRVHNTRLRNSSAYARTTATRIVNDEIDF